MYIVTKTDSYDSSSFGVKPIQDKDQAIAYAASLIYDMRDEFSPLEPEPREVLLELLTHFRNCKYEAAIECFNKHHISILVEYKYFSDEEVAHKYTEELPPISMDAANELDELTEDKSTPAGTSIEFEEEEEL